jgi:hypothetical protein
MKFDIQEFFKLPMEEKKKYWQEPEDLEGYGQVFVVSEDQKLDWGDMFYMVTLPTYLRKPHLFPKLPIPFRSDLSLSLSLSLSHDEKDSTSNRNATHTVQCSLSDMIVKITIIFYLYFYSLFHSIVIFITKSGSKN